MSGGTYINGIQKGLVAPLVDAADNETVAEVVGNKSDTVAGTSLVALVKQIVAAVPPTADVTAIKAVTDLIPDAGAMTSIAQEATLGAPVGASLSADIAAVQTDVTAIKAVTDVLPDAGALTSLAQDLTVAKEATLGAPVGASLSADMAAVQSAVDGLNDISASDVNNEVDTALNTIVPASPTAGSLNDVLSKASGGNTFDKATDSLEAIRDIIDTNNTSDQVDLDAILEDTSTTLPSTLSGIETKIDTVDTVVDGIQTDLDNATDGLGALKTLIDTVQSTADNIETDTQDLQTQIGAAGLGLSAIPDMAKDSNIEILLDHIHMPCKVYPTLADGVTVTADATAWTLGAFVVVVPASTITAGFDIHHISVEALSANDIYELVLYSGADLSETEIGRVRFTKNANQDGTMDVPFQTPINAANSQIKAKLATNAGSSTADISIFYHTY
jgi:hypothetical protein